MNTNKVTRFELIDHRKCEECEGDGWVAVPNQKGEPTQQQCVNCHGSGVVGRTVYIHDKSLQFDVELQDRERTLKVFVHERYE